MGWPLIRAAEGRERDPERKEGRPMRSRSFGSVGVACLLLLALGSVGGQETQSEAARHIEDAQKLAAAGKLDEAVAAVKKALDLEPKNDLYLALASDFERQAGLFSDGLAHARKAIEINGKVGAYYVLAAANAHGTQDLGTARDYVRKVYAGATEFGPQAVKSARLVEALLVKKVYTLTFECDPRKGQAESGAYRVALPRDDLPYQSTTYKVTGAKSSRVVKNEADHFLTVVPQGTKPFQLVMEVSVQPYTYKEKLSSAKPEATPKDVRPYLGPSYGINPASPALKKVVAGLKSSDPAGKVRDLTVWMKKNITYKTTGTTIEKVDFKSAEEILERGHAECYAYSVLFTALCRAAGVPARQIWGLYMKPDGSGFASHNWCEVHIGGVGWVPIDPQNVETFGMLPNTHVRFLMPLKSTARSTEPLPQFNLLYMCKGDIRYETKVEWLSVGR
jgi:tetratricopeptide (TPR) repeat protein